VMVALVALHALCLKGMFNVARRSRPHAPLLA